MNARLLFFIGAGIFVGQIVVAILKVALTGD